MKTFEIEKTPPKLRQAARSLRGDVLVLTQRGKPAFVLVGLGDDFSIEALALGRNKAFMSYLDAISTQSRGERRYSTAQLRSEFGLRRRARATKKPKGRRDRGRS